MSILRLPGSKKRVLSQYAGILPAQCDVFYEPMVGTGQVAFELMHTRAKKIWVTDFSTPLVYFYMNVIMQGDTLAEVYELHRSDYSSSEPPRQAQLYYNWCDFWNTNQGSWLTKGLELAVVFLLLNQTCFNGLYRVNASGQYNTPWGRKKKLSEMTTRLHSLRTKLEAATLSPPADFAKMPVTQLGEDDVVFFDSPYWGTFNDYTAGGFTWADQVRLKNFAQMIREQYGARVFAANSASSDIITLYAGWKHHDIWAHRSMSCRGDGRGQEKELLMEAP